MKRYALETLKNWKNKPNRKPLVMRGARQVGKTWLLKEFGRQCYKNVAYLSFYDNESAKAVFGPAYDIKNIIAALEILTNTHIVPGETLIILDEIQECDRALNALKFFNENAKQYHIAVAGSLLGVAINHKKMSFPVGQVDFVTLHPLSFCEFLDATGQDQMATLVFNNNNAVISSLSDKYTQALRLYTFVGGMPEAVQTFITTNDYNAVRKVQNDILLGYQNDFSKYTDNYNVARIKNVWDSIPAQLAKENKKFTYNKMSSSARSREYQDAIEWLNLCGLVHIVHKISKPDLPLSGYAESNAFKVYMLDCGLLGAKAGLPVKTIIEGNKIFEEFKGALTEQYVLQELCLNNDITVTYWSSGAEAEVDFVVQYSDMIIPMEVKATTNLKSKSLDVYRKKYVPEMAVRTSLAGYAVNNGLYAVPLYMIENLFGILDNK